MSYDTAPSLFDLTSLSMTISRSIHVAANGIISFFLVTGQYFIVYTDHIFFIHSSVDGHLGCFHVLTIVHFFSECWGACILLDHVFIWIYTQ